MSYLIGFIVIAIYYFIGIFITSWLNVPIPSSIISMLLLFFSLHFKLIPVHWIKNACVLLITLLPLFFIPASLGLIEHVDLLFSNLFPLLGATLLSSLVVLIVTAKMLEKYKGEKS